MANTSLEVRSKESLITEMNQVIRQLGEDTLAELYNALGTEDVRYLEDNQFEVVGESQIQGEHVEELLNENEPHRRAGEAAVVALYYSTDEPPRRNGRTDEEYAQDFLQWDLYKALDAGRPIDGNTGEDYNLHAYYDKVKGEIVA